MSTFQTKGISAFYNGVIISCCLQSIYRGLYFGVYDSLRMYLIPQKNWDFPICLPLAYVAAFISSNVLLPLQNLTTKVSETKNPKFVLYWRFQQLFRGINCKYIRTLHQLCAYFGLSLEILRNSILVSAWNTWSL